MKRFFIILTILIMAASLLLSGCSLSDAGREKELEDVLKTTYEELGSTFSGEEGSYSLVAEYLSSWAKKNSIEVTESDEHYIVLTNPATKNNGSSKSAVFQCSLETSDMKSSVETLAIGMTALLGPDSHGDISLIVTENNNGEFTGAKALPEKYCGYDNLINLTHSKDTKLLDEGAFEMTGKMSSEISMTVPSYSNAFAITMSMPEFTDPFAFDKNYPNPVEVIGGLLATEKSSGKLFQIASFECEETAGYNPSSATAIVVVDENNIESFTKKFEKSYENMEERFDKLEDDFVYTMTETSMPDYVMSNQSSDNIISLMYTLKTGIYLQEEDSGLIVSASGISSISTSGEELNVTVTARSLMEETLDEMSCVFLTTSGLCDIEYEASDKRKLWTSDSKTSGFFREALELDETDQSSAVKSSECELFAEKNHNLSIISYYCNMDKGQTALANLLHFTESLAK